MYLGKQNKFPMLAMSKNVHFILHLEWVILEIRPFSEKLDCKVFFSPGKWFSLVPFFISFVCRNFFSFFFHFNSIFLSRRHLLLTACWLKFRFLYLSFKILCTVALACFFSSYLLSVIFLQRGLSPNWTTPFSPNMLCIFLFIQSFCVLLPSPTEFLNSL